MKTILVQFILLFMMACSSHKTKQEMTITIELDIYSGRPNPSWKMDVKQTNDLLQKLAKLYTLPKAELDVQDGLGYRGFIIKVVDDNKKDEAPIIVKVFHGIIKIDDNLFEDTILLEKNLLNQAKQNGYKNIIESLGE
jgi:hypothetical protein